MIQQPDARSSGAVDPSQAVSQDIAARQLQPVVLTASAQAREKGYGAPARV